jgi:hypothetical protein
VFGSAISFHPGGKAASADRAEESNTGLLLLDSTAPESVSPCSGVTVDDMTGAVSWGVAESGSSASLESPCSAGCKGTDCADAWLTEGTMLLRFGVDSCAKDVDGADAICRVVVSESKSGDESMVVDWDPKAVEVVTAAGLSAALGVKVDSVFFRGVAVEKVGGSLNFFPLYFFTVPRVAEGGGKGSFLVLDERGDMAEIFFPSMGEGSGVSGGVARGVEVVERPRGVGRPAAKDPDPVETVKGGPEDFDNGGANAVSWGFPSLEPTTGGPADTLRSVPPICGWGETAVGGAPIGGAEELTGMPAERPRGVGSPAVNDPDPVETILGGPEDTDKGGADRVAGGFPVGAGALEATTGGPVDIG